MQELDSRADQLRHQRASLPEIVRIAELETGRGDVDDRLRDARIVVDDLTVEQKKADADVEQVKARRTRDRDRMDQGLITNPKDLERMQHELESLERRIGSLEDTELEIMEQLEEAQRTVDTLAAQLAETDEQIAELAEVRDGRWVEIDASLAETETAARHRRRGPARRPAGALRAAARPEGRRGRRGPARAPVRRLPARRSMPPSWGSSGPRRPTRSCGARSARGSWCAPRSPACDLTGQVSRTTTSSCVPRGVVSPSSTCQPSAPSAFARA